MNLPEALLEDLSGTPGFERSAFLEAHRQTPPVSVRLHPQKWPAGTQNTFAGKVPWSPQGGYLEQRPLFALDPLWHGGAYYVQEASSMLAGWAVTQLFPDRSGLRVLDLCAAPGGKSTHIASLLPSDALLVSNEVIRSRAGILEENAIRWGAPNHWVSSNDPAAFGRLKNYFDLIVVDAPCSGSGLFRKDPDAQNEWSTEAVNRCAARQQRILHDVWPALRPGGALLYATCSYSPAEDEGLLDAFLAGATDAQALLLEPPAAWGIVATVSPKQRAAGLRCFPNRVLGEGFFMAALQKQGTLEKAEAQRPRRSAGNREVRARAGELLKPADWVCLPFLDQFTALEASFEGDYQLLQKVLYFRNAGVRLGVPAGKDWIPDHALALSVAASPELPAVELNLEQSLQFLRRQELDPAGIAPGWQRVLFKGVALGWVKGLKARVNNYLPKGLRLRLELTAQEAAPLWHEPKA